MLLTWTVDLTALTLFDMVLPLYVVINLSTKKICIHHLFYAIFFNKQYLMQHVMNYLL